MPLAQNHISAAFSKSSYAVLDLILFIDGEPLDLMLDRIAPGYDLKGLVPTLLGCESEAESAVVRERILPDPGVTLVVPVLMCPDDADFSCTLVVAEVVGSSDSVEWRRLGLDATPDAADPARVGEKVEWLEGIGPFRFARSDYLAALSSFKDTRRPEP